MAQAKYRKPILHAVANEPPIEGAKVTKLSSQAMRGKSAPGPLDLPEDQLLAQLGAAIERKAFTPKFLDGLRRLLGERRASRAPPADGPIG